MIEALTSLAAFDKAAPTSSSAAASLLQRVATPANQTAPADFGSVMAQLAAGTAQSLKAGEAASIAGLQGKATAQQVVEAVMSAEQSLQTAIAIRDKVVSAYLELSRMSI
ncbi:flagellar hook-basal body complex protein FliE [Methylobacterium oryzihabitans]|uniref:Flagellar hook-basal body complex protein FliE n=1 Tax=Methylobacterium oryzihabitans TaxID=2499852 RepID=A0A437PDC2_9HYPH|nr:flagellar hook-basal body complex protein FliE [Methylobacterium oryzihabitans]RVU20262.1 flagellar hook-basal body complex protein FliE [Methylobacterium oryzihabitans]